MLLFVLRQVWNTHPMRRSLPVSRTALFAAVSLVALVSCGGSGDADTNATVPTAEVESTIAASSETTSVETTALPAAESMRGKRYCEFLLLNPTANGIEATVYNSFPLGDCPDEQWSAIDPPAVAAAEGAVFALANGPRYWLMDSVGRDTSDVITKTLGGIAMNRYATVTITDPKSVGIPFTTQKVDRKSTFTFFAGSEVYLLVDPDGRRFVMQSWSQQRDPDLEEADLAGLASRLELPTGWSYEVEQLTEDLVVGADRAVAEVLQDDLQNSYSLIT